MWTVLWILGVFVLGAVVGAVALAAWAILGDAAGPD